MAGTALTAREEWQRNWPTVLVAVFGISCSTLYVYSAGTLLAPIQAATGWSRAQIGSGITVVTLFAIISNPVVGVLVDRFGARRMAIAAITLFPLSFAAIGLSGQHLWSWWFHWALLGVAGLAMTPSTWSAGVARLFDRSRGLAFAVTMCGNSLGAIAIPLASAYLVGTVGWRGTFLGLGLIWGGIGLPLVLFLMRDGHGTGSAAVEVATTPGYDDLPVHRALLSRQFIALATAVAFFTYVTMSFVMTIVPILVWQGIDAKRAAGLASMLGLTAIAGRLTTGYLLDRVDARIISSVGMSLPIFAIALLWAMPGSTLAAAGAILILGFGLGAEMDCIAYLITRYFGVGNFGLMFGVVISMTAIATSIAPLIAGLIYDATGGYHLLIVILLFPCLVSVLAIATLGRIPERTMTP